MEGLPIDIWGLIADYVFQMVDFEAAFILRRISRLFKARFEAMISKNAIGYVYLNDKALPALKRAKILDLSNCTGITKDGLAALKGHSIETIITPIRLYIDHWAIEGLIGAKSVIINWPEYLDEGSLWKLRDSVILNNYVPISLDSLCNATYIEVNTILPLFNPDKLKGLEHLEVKKIDELMQSGPQYFKQAIMKLAYHGQLNYFWYPEGERLASEVNKAIKDRNRLLGQ
jgi:hypothetical protein